ncbi:hypothetical protein GEMRC1_007796 [Eukaryota sp. GEM-RC1]
MRRSLSFENLTSHSESLELLFSLWRLSLIIVFVASSVYLLVGQLFLQQDWTQFDQAGCLPTCYYESVSQGFCRQAVNGWTSIGFCLSSIWIMMYYKQLINYDRDVVIQQYNSMVYATILMLLGLGSKWYHCALTLKAERLDGLGMHFFGGYIACYSVARAYVTLFKRKKISLVPRIFLSLFLWILLIITIANLFIDRWGRLTWNILIGQLVVTVLAEGITLLLKARTPSKNFFWTLAWLAFSYVLWELDRQYILCWPHSFFQAHGVWHIGLSISVVLLFLFYNE